MQFDEEDKGRKKGETSRNTILLTLYSPLASSNQIHGSMDASRSTILSDQRSSRRNRTTSNLHEGIFLPWNVSRRVGNTHASLEDCHFTVEVTGDKRSIPNRGIYLSCGRLSRGWLNAGTVLRPRFFFFCSRRKPFPCSSPPWRVNILCGG